MSTPASALPAAMQARMQRLSNNIEGAPAGNTPPATNGEGTPPAGNTPPATNGEGTPPTGQQGTPPATNGEGTPPAANEGDRVTLSRTEYNDLRANANRVQALVAREGVQADRLAELTQRLTELENSNKAGSNTPPASQSAPGAPVIDTSTISFTDDENNQYGDSRAYIEKVVDLRVAERLNKLVPELRTQIDEARTQATQATTTVQQTAQRSFLERVTAAVPDMTTLIKHRNWEAFLDTTDDLSGATYDVLLAHNVKNQNLKGVQRIYNMFRKEYVDTGTAPAANAGFAGAAPAGGAGQVPPDQQPTEKLKLSDRKKASEDFRKNRITWAQLEEVNRKFDEADKAGNVDYNA